MLLIRKYFKLSFQIWMAIGSYLCMVSYYKGHIYGFHMNEAIDVFVKCVFIGVIHKVIYMIFKNKVKMQN